MNLFCNRIGLLMFATCVTMASAQSAPLSTTATEQTREVAAWLAGSFSNQSQAGQDKAFHAIALHMQPIWTQRAGEHWLYVEQSLAATPDKPYRQRVYCIAWKDGPVSEVYLLPGDAAAFIGAWRDTAVFDRLSPDDLSRKEGCSIWLEKQSDGSYRGATRGAQCASERDGAAYTKAEVTLDAKLLTSWDRGFAADDKQVWGSTAGAYRFERQPAQ